MSNYTKSYYRFIKENLSSDEKLDIFLNELGKKGSLVRSPFNNKEFIYNSEASIEIDRFDKKDRNEITLRDIVVFDKRQGVGSRVMQDIVDVADKIGYTITLDAKPFGDDIKMLKTPELVKFYQKFGFEVDMDGYDGEFKTPDSMIKYATKYDDVVPMIRTPK